MKIIEVLITDKGLKEFSIKYKGQVYRFITGSLNENEIKKWFQKIVKESVECASCHRLIIPPARLGRISGSLVHFKCAYPFEKGGEYLGFLLKGRKIRQRLSGAVINF